MTPSQRARITCDVLFKSVSGRTEDLLDRHIHLSSSDQLVPIGRGSKRRSDRGVPERHNSLYTSPVVSREHAELCLGLDQARSQSYLHIKDLSSTHGTFVNGQRLRPEVPMRLCCGDQVTLGSDIIPATGPNIRSVTFEVRFTFQKHEVDAGEAGPVIKSISESFQAPDTTSGPAMSRNEKPGIIIIDDEDLALEETSCQDQIRQASEISNPFVVPYDSEDFSEDDFSNNSEADWSDSLGVEKCEKNSSETKLGTLSPAVDLSSRTEHSEQPNQQMPELENFSCAKFWGSMQLPDLPPRPCTSHTPEDGAGTALSSAADGTSEEAPEPSSWHVQAPIDLESALAPSPREKLSIQNLISTPYGMSQAKDADAAAQQNQTVFMSCSLKSQPATGKGVEDASTPPFDTERAIYSPSDKQDSIYALKRGHATMSDAHDEASELMETAPARSTASAHKSAEKISDASPRKKIRFDIPPTYEQGSLSANNGLQPFDRGTGYFPPATSTFLLGTIFGGMAMLGGLVALPESFFS